MEGRNRGSLDFSVKFYLLSFGMNISRHHIEYHPVDKDGNKIIYEASKEKCYICGRTALDLESINKDIRSFFKDEVVKANNDLERDEHNDREIYWNNKALEEMDKHVLVDLKESIVGVPEPHSRINASVWICTICEQVMRHYGVQ